MKRLVIMVSLGLAACNGASSPAPEATAPRLAGTLPQYVTSPSFRLPEGGGCTGEIARFEAVMGNDLATGHVHKTVHGTIMDALAPARSACAAGRDAQAISQLRAVKSRYGYP